MKAPIFIGELELTEPIKDIRLPGREDGLAYNGVRLLVRMQDTPVGYAFLAPDALAGPAVAGQVWQQLCGAINARRSSRDLDAIDSLPTAGLAFEEKLADKGTDHPLVTVVLCTRDRPEGAVVTMRRLTGLRYEPFEIVVVDNAPSSEATKTAIMAEFGGDPRVRYVREPRPGLSCARNCGVAAAAGDIVAFTDDDVRVDPRWLDGIVRGFGPADDVACVTGLVATAEIDNAIQLYFHHRTAWGTALSQRIFDLTDNRDDSPLYPYLVGIYGTGANFAMTKSALKELGPFDEALGAGSPCGGGEDVDMFLRVILAGHRLAYEPSAVVWHVHRAELSELSRQMTAYGSGCTAALTAMVMRNPQVLLKLAAGTVRGLQRITVIGGRVQGNPALPSGLMLREVCGMLAGPWLYVKGRRRLRCQPEELRRPLSRS
jgi:O-antigen biosynthesis protein